MNLEELRKKYAALIAEAKRLSGAGDLSEEAAKKIDSLLGEADGVKTQISRLEAIAAGEAYMTEPAGSKAAHLGWRESGPEEGNVPVDAKAWRSIEVPMMTRFGIQKKEIRFHVPLAVQGKNYDFAFESYLRKGRLDMGPNDRKALAEATDAAGGYLVPEQWQTGVIRKMATLATVRQYARVIQTSRDVAKWARIKYTTNNEYTSGVRLTWTGETPSSATVHRVTDQVFGEIAVPVNTAMASQLLSVDLIQDAAYDVLGISSELMAEAFGLGENDMFWNGSGAGRPRGILVDAADTANFDAAIATIATGNTLAADDVIDCAYALPAQYERNARWFWTKATEKLIRKLADTDGEYLWPVTSRVGGLGAPDPELLGFPISRDEFVNDMTDASNTTTYPLVLGDLTGYLIVDRVGMSMQRLDEIYSETNQVLLLAKKRVGGQLSEAYRLSLVKAIYTT